MSRSSDPKIITTYCFILVAMILLIVTPATLADTTGGNDAEKRSGTITLSSPKEARVVTTIGVGLEWNVTGVDISVMEFDVYVSEDEAKVAGNNLTVLFATNLKSTSMKAMILLDLKTYHWKVVGRDTENGTDISSTIGQFSIDRSIKDPNSYIGISISEKTPEYGQEVNISAVVPNTFGSHITYSWTFTDDHTTLEGTYYAMVPHSFERYGSQTVHLTVTDELGNEQSTSIEVDVGGVDDDDVADPAEDKGMVGKEASSSICISLLAIMIVIVIVIIIIAAKIKEKEREKKQFKVPSHLYKTQGPAGSREPAPQEEWHIESQITHGFRNMQDELRLMTQATKDLIKGEKFGRTISVFIVIFAVSTLFSAYLQSSSNQDSTNEYSIAISNLEESNTDLLLAESTIDRDRTLLEEARKFYVEGENLLWKYIQKAMSGPEGTYYNEKGDSLIAFNNAYDSILQTGMIETVHIRDTYSVNLDDFDDFIPWDYPVEQVKLVSRDILKILDDYDSKFDDYQEGLKEDSEERRVMADEQFENAKELGNQGLIFTRATTFFSIATSVVGISIIPKNKHTRKFLIGIGIVIYAIGILFMLLQM